ncbi:MAG: hypothetical protein LBP19_00965 [Treponema sp.]|nr:hypothetical protein [Treponema sp.]
MENKTDGRASIPYANGLMEQTGAARTRYGAVFQEPDGAHKKAVPWETALHVCYCSRTAHGLVSNQSGRRTV